MHGRVKVKSTAQQQEEKRIEREGKLKSYRKAMAAILARRAEGARDAQQLALTAGVLQANADIGTLWNIRREVVLVLAKPLEDGVEEDIVDEAVREANKVERDAIFRKEVDLTQTCLTTSPKSYGAWHHRAWALDHMARPDWERELALTAKFLSMDERNFHCWDYRQAVATKAGVDPKSELEFTTDRIETNFSNYSAWHYRSKLLPLVHPSGCSTNSSNKSESSFPVAEEAHHKELDLVQNAAFTDPEDSSAWLYHAWLAGRSRSPPAIVWLSSGDGVVSLATNQKIEAGNLTTWIEGQEKRLEWEATSRFSNLWRAKLSPGSLFEAALAPEGPRLGLKTTSERQVKATLFEFDNPPSEITRGVLEEQLENCKQLLELEPESKWPLLTQARLMKCLDKEGYHDAILATYSTLQTVDPLRRAYYKDMSSNLVIEKALRAVSDFSCLDLTNAGGLKVTKEQAKGYNQYLAAFDSVRFDLE